MSKNFESGHTKNVANFATLITFCTAHGVIYYPSKALIKLPALNSKLTAARLASETVSDRTPAWTTAVDARQSLFEPLDKLITRVLNAVKTSDVSEKLVEDAESYTRKIHGTRATPKHPVVLDDPNTPEDESQNYHSAAQLSFDSRIENFSKLIKLLASQPGYIPNETELTVASLTTLLTSMRTASAAVATAFAPLSNARIARNKVLYEPHTGLFSQAAEVKMYIKSLFGATSGEYKQVSHLKFTEA